MLFNWELGRDLVQKKAEERWGAGVVEQVNADGFSTTNLWYMKQWYLFYYQQDTKLQRSVAEIGKTKLHQVGGETEILKLHQLGGEFSLLH